MKLRNLMYATMIACAFASCSNDDVPTRITVILMRRVGQV